MFPLKTLAFAFAILFSTLGYLAHGDGREGANIPAQEKTIEMGVICNGQELKLSNQTLTKYSKIGNECLVKFPYPNRNETQENGTSHYCFPICNLQGVGILDAMGAFNETGTAHFTKEFFPTEDLSKNATQIVKDCAEKFGVTKALSMDKHCESYSKFLFCLDGESLKICKAKSIEEDQNKAM